VRARDRYEELFKRRFCAFQRGVLVETMGSIEDPTLGDLMACLDGGGYRLADNDPLTVGDVLGVEGGPRLVEVLESFGLPLDSPLDVAEPRHLALALAQLLAPSDRGTNGDE
jgi:hypothetical protein